MNESQPDGTAHGLLGGGNGFGAVEVVNLHGLGFSLHNDGAAIFEAELRVVIRLVLQ